MNSPLAVPELPRISDYLFYYAQREPSRTFMVFGDERLTYADAAEQVSALSRALLDAGVNEGDRVATLSTPRPEFALTFLASVDIGATWVGLNPKYTIGELQHVVADSAPKVLFGLTEHDGRQFEDDLHTLGNTESVTTMITIGGGIPGALTMEEFIVHGRGLSDSDRTAARVKSGGSQPALIVYTSGTTGIPKGAVLSHKSLVWSFLRQGQRWAGVDPIRIICNLPINHSGCVGDNFSSCLTAGGTLIFMARFDPDAMLELIPHEQVNVLMQIPTMYQVLASRPAFATADLSSLRLLVWGGAAMPKPVLTAWARPGLVPAVVYGQSEAPASITFSDAGATFEQLTETIGRPDPDMEVRIAHPDGSACEPGEAGEIQIKHPSLFLRYHGNPQATKEAFTPDGFLHTGDKAVERPDGYFHMVGRLKEMFKSGGYNVYPKEVELCLESHPDLMFAVVVNMPDPLYGEVGHAFVVPRPGSDVSVEELTKFCREHLANYKVPKAITIQDSLPMLPIGKPDKQALRATAAARSDSRQVN